MSRACKIQSTYITKFKVSVIGCGSVGSTAAYAMLMDGTPTEMVLMDINKEKAQGLSLDFAHSMPFWHYAKITPTDDYEACRDSNLIVVTAGARQQEGETRLDLINKNRAIFKQMIPALAKVAPRSILLIVTNPVDVLVSETLRLSGFPENQVFGSGTMLDTARFRYHISERLCLSPQSINAFILGEHGDSSFPLMSTATVAGKPLFEFQEFTPAVAEECYQETKNAAYRIIHDLGFTCYSIATVIREIMIAVFQHSRLVLPLSVNLHDYYGHSDVALSVPVVLDSDGVSDVLKVPFDKVEQEKLAKSVEVLKSYLG